MTRPAVLNSLGLAISSGLNFISMMCWVRLLTPIDFGKYTLLTTTALLINAIAFEWARIVGGRTLFSAKSETLIDQDKANYLFTLVSAIIAVITAIAIILVVSGKSIFGLEPYWLLIVLIFIVSEVALTMLNVVNRARGAVLPAFTISTARSALSLMLGLIFVLALKRGLTGVLLGLVIGQGAAVIGGIATDSVWRKLRLRGAKSEDRLHMTGMLKMGAPIMLSSGLSYGAGVLDRYQVEHVLGSSSVAYYAAPADLLQKTLGFTMTAINITVYPSMVRAYEEKGKLAARDMLEGNAIWYLAICLPVLVATIVLPFPISAILLGKRVAQNSYSILPVVTAAALIRLLTVYHLQIALQLAVKMKLLMVAPAIALLEFALLGLPALRTFGLEGIAWVSFTAQSSAYLTCGYFARRSLGIRLLKMDNVKVFMAGVVMALVMMPFSAAQNIGSTILALAVGGTSYLLSIMIFRVKEADKLRAMFRRN